MALLALAAVLALLGRGSVHRLANEIARNKAFLLLLIAGFAVERAAGVALAAFISPLVSVPSSIRILTPLIITIQEAIPAGVGAPIFGAVYVLLFLFLLVLVPLLLLACDRTRFRRYAVALLVTYALCLAAHTLIGSVRPGLDPSSGISPLLYDDPLWGALSAGLMGRGSSLPSTHVAVITVMLLSAWGMRKLDLALLGVLAAMSAAVIYLGVHWPVDVAAGIATGAAGWLIASMIKNGTKGRSFSLWRPVSR